MSETGAKEWRLKKATEIEQPEFIVPPKVLEENARKRRERENIQETIVENFSYRVLDTDTHYTREPEYARDGQGAIRGQRVQERKKYPARRLLAGMFATLVIGGAITINQVSGRVPNEVSTTVMQEAGYTPNSLGLTPEVADQLKEYETFFDNFDSKTIIPEADVISRIEGVEALKNEVLRSKFASLYGVPLDQVGDPRITYDSDMQQNVTIRVGNKTIGNSFLPIFKRKDISNDVKHLIQRFEDINDLMNAVLKDEMPKDIAIEILGSRYFEPLEVIANAEFIKDDHDNVTVLYQNIKEVAKEVKEAEKTENRKGKHAQGRGDEER